VLQRWQQLAAASGILAQPQPLVSPALPRRLCGSHYMLTACALRLLPSLCDRDPGLLAGRRFAATTVAAIQQHSVGALGNRADSSSPAPDPAAAAVAPWCHSYCCRPPIPEAVAVGCHLPSERSYSTAADLSLEACRPLPTPGTLLQLPLPCSFPPLASICLLRPSCFTPPVSRFPQVC
jgi:hypothetical protein